MSGAVPNLTPDQLQTVRAILAAHMPAGFTAHVFGSRAEGTPKPWSDLDLVVEGPCPLPFAVTAALAEAFDESDLPWKVDLVDRTCVSPTFGAIIDAGKIPLD
jgi:predicted nucleotidyltransferase